MSNRIQILEFTHRTKDIKFFIDNNGSFYSPDIPNVKKSLDEMIVMRELYFISSFRRPIDGQLFNSGDLVYGHYRGVGGKAFYTKENPGKIKEFLFSAGAFYANFGDSYVINSDNLIKCE